MKVALVGNQNSGKSTLFNTMTGLNQKIGNWPGVTIEKKTGIIKNTNIEIIDLPGIYSLRAYTKEEEITIQNLKNNEIDAIINIIDCNSISRGLYLTLQLLEKNIPIILALNMHEIAEKKGTKIDEEILSQELGNIPVIKISALTGQGIVKINSELRKIKIFSKQENLDKNRIEKIIYEEKFKNNNESKQLKNQLQEENKIINSYQRIDGILEKTITKTKNKNKNLTEQLDKIILNKYFSIPIFVLIMFIIYFISIEIVGNYTIDKMTILFEKISNTLRTWLLEQNTWEALTSLIVDGIISGISAVISFLPQLVFLFISISCLEKVGYMSRISLIFDKIFKKLGMSGSSVISFILGTGCSVPGIMATRTIKNEREKKITSILTPFIPCSAKLPIISLFTNYFFRENSGLVAVSFYLLSIMVIIVSSCLFQKINKSKREISYIAELPEYRIPKMRQVLKDSWGRVWDFMKRAGSIILISSIVVWVLLSYSFKLEFGVNVQDSILADIGRTFSGLFVPMVGENSWEIAVSTIQGLIAKEQVISSMSIIAGLETEHISNNMFVTGSPFTFFTPLSAYAYVCFNLFSAPCFGAIGAMKKTLGGTKNMLKAVGFQIGLAYIISCLIYGVGTYIFL